MAVIRTKKEPSWVTYVRTRIKNKKNFLVQINGPTGSGKSWAGLSIALQLDDSFGPQRIIFGFRKLIELINSGEKFKAGTCFVWDEFHIEAGARDWQSLTNKLLNSLLSTFRHKFFILIITSPYSDFIDSQSRKLIHAEFQTLKIDEIERKTKLKPMLLQYNSRNKKFYYKYLRIKTQNGISPLISWKVPAPPQWLIDEYEKMKTDFTTNLNKDIERQLNELEQKEAGRRKPLTELQEKAMRLMAKYDNIEQVAKEMGFTQRTAYFHIAQAHKKLYRIEEFRDDEEENSA